MIDATVYGPLATRQALRGSGPINMEEVRTALGKICAANNMAFTHQNFVRDHVAAEAWFVQRSGAARDGSTLTIEFSSTASQPEVVAHGSTWPELWLIIRQPEFEEMSYHNGDFSRFADLESMRAISGFVNTLAKRLREALPQWATDTDDARRERLAQGRGACEPE